MSVPNLKIFFAVRESLSIGDGGDAVQVFGTAGALEKLGVSVTISSDYAADLSGYDCVHLWQLERVHESFAHLLNARRFDRPVVLSTIYWPAGGRSLPTGGFRARLKAWKENAKNRIRLRSATSHREREAIRAALRIGWSACRKELLQSPDVLLPNSRAEAEMLAREAGAAVRCRPIPNAIDADACRSVLGEPGGGQRDGIVCVGHFDPRKNQLGLIEALKGSSIPVTFIGAPRGAHGRYYRRCRKLAGDDFQFAGSLDGCQVLRRLRAARLHVCASRLETPGLANLEAAAMGCGLVVPDCTPVREYFGGEATYFTPGDVESLRRAVMDALDAPVSPGLAERVLGEYTWQAAADATLAAYRVAIREHR